MDDGLPGNRLVRGGMLALALGIVVGLYLLIATPTLPNEQERTGGAPPPGATSAAGTRVPGGGAPAPSASPAATAPADGVAEATPTTSPQPERRHTIRSGDTLLAIAEQYDTTVDAIRAANPGLSETALQVGQEITIPPSR